MTSVSIPVYDAHGKIQYFQMQAASDASGEYVLVCSFQEVADTEKVLMIGSDISGTKLSSNFLYWLAAPNKPTSATVGGEITSLKLIEAEEGGVYVLGVDFTPK